MVINETSVERQKYDICYGIGREKQVGQLFSESIWCILWVQEASTMFVGFSPVCQRLGLVLANPTPRKHLEGISRGNCLEFRVQRSNDIIPVTSQNRFWRWSQQKFYTLMGAFFFLRRLCRYSLLLWNITHIFSFTTPSMCDMHCSQHRLIDHVVGNVLNHEAYFKSETWRRNLTCRAEEEWTCESKETSFLTFSVKD